MRPNADLSGVKSDPSSLQKFALSARVGLLKAVGAYANWAVPISTICVSFVFVLIVTDGFSVSFNSKLPPACAVIDCENGTKAGCATNTTAGFPIGRLSLVCPLLLVVRVWPAYVTVAAAIATPFEASV